MGRRKGNSVWRFLPGLLLAAAAGGQDLIVNDLRPQVIAYEIPDPEGRPEAVQYIEMVRDRFYKGVEIVDASALNEAALRLKLQGTVALYTILRSDSRLLRLAAEPLPLRIENGNLHWADFSTPVNDVRMVFAGKNPFGDGYWKVYAAGSNALLAHANDIFHGPASYDIYRGDGRGQLLREGNYYSNFIATLEQLSRADATADIQEFFSTLEQTHPHLLAQMTRTDYEALKKQTLAGLPQQVPIADLAWRLSYAAAAFKDGHTGVYWAGPRLTEANTQGKRFPPFWLDSENGRFFISAAIPAATDASLTGAEIVSINGIPVTSFFQPILERISGETRTYRAALLVARQAFWYAFSNVFAAESYPVKLRGENGETRQIDMRTVDWSEFQRLAPQRARAPDTHLEFLDDGKVARLVIPTLVYLPERRQTEEIFDQAFARIRESKATDLIIDIRGNSGGDSSMGEYVLKLVRSFKGKTYMLTDHYDFSSAVIFADTFRDRQVGTLIGYETGGTPTHFGFPQTFSLKKSGIRFICSRRSFRALKPRPGDAEHGVIPDIAVTRDLLRPYRRESDPVLAFAVVRIRERRGLRPS
jgi:C-terminal processing protease CtpA/Prc